MLEDHKQCNRCFEIKSITDFRKTTKKCKACESHAARIYRATHPDAVAAAKKAYNRAHKEKVAAWVKRHYLKNRERRLVYLKSYYQTNKEAYKAHGRAYYLANKSVMQEQNRLYRQVNREAILLQKKIYAHLNRDKLKAQRKAYTQTAASKASDRAHLRNRRSKSRFAFGELATAADFLAWEKEGAVCYLTGCILAPGTVTWDHVVPLHWGGTHDVFNIMPAHRSANISKRTKIVYFDLITREACYTLDPCPGGVGPNGEIWPGIPLTQPTRDEMQEMVDAWRARRMTRTV